VADKEYTAGYVYAAVLPSLRDFKPDLDRQLAGINPEITVIIKPKVDPSSLPEAEGGGAAAGSAYGDAFEAAVKSRIEAALRSLPDIDVDADTSEAGAKLAEIRAALDELGKVEIGVDIDPAVALAVIDGLRADLDELATDNPDIQLRVDASDASAKLSAIADDVTRLDHRTATIDVRVDQASLALAESDIDKIKSDASGGGAGISTAGLIAGGIGVGAGPLAAGALVAVPAVFAAIGIAAEHSNAQVSASLTAMENSAKKTLAEGFDPFVPTLVDLDNQAGKTLAGLQPELSAAAYATAPLIQTLGTGVLNAAKVGVGGAATLIGQLQPEAQATATGLTQIAHGVGGFFDAIDAGRASQGLETLFDDVDQILPAVARLINEVDPLGNALLQVLGPAFVSAVNDAEALDPAISAVAATLRFLQPDIVTLGPPLAAALVAVKLLTGSWTDFSGAAAAVKAGITGLPDAIESLGQKLGYTSAASNSAAKAVAQQADSLAQLKKGAADEAVVLATLNSQQTGTQASALALAEAEREAAVAAEEAEAAEAALAETTDAMAFSFGPLGAILGGLGLLIAPLIANATSASQSADQLTGSLDKLQQAASDTKSLSDLFQSNPQAQQQLALLQKYGVTLQDLTSANNGNAAAQQKVAAAAKQASDAINAQYDADKKQLSQFNDAEAQIAATGSSYDELAQDVQKAQTAVNADTAARQLANATYKDASDQVTATAQAQAAATTVTRSATTQWTSAIQGASQAVVAHGGDLLATTQQMYNFEIASNSSTYSAENFEKAQISAAGANIQASQSFAQLDEAASSASASYKQSIQAVSDASESERQAAEGVVTAEEGVQAAVRGVATAEQNAAQAQVSAVQAQQNLTAARAAATQQLEDYNNELKDQADTEAEAKLRVLEAQEAVNAAGLQGTSLASLGGPTDENKANYELLLSLDEAQNNLNDTSSQSAQLQAQAAAAQAAGVNGNAQVIAAEQQVVQAQQQEAAAAQSLIDARNAVTAAGKAVTDAEYNQQRASEAVTQAVSAEHQALTAATTAKDAASRSTDINTDAGNRNATTIIGLYDAQIAAGKSTADATTEVENETGQLGFSKAAVDAIITSIQAVPPSVTFGIVGQPSLDLSALVQAANAQGIDPYSLGLPAASVTSGLQAAGAGDPRANDPRNGGYASGGQIGGYSPTPTADNVPIMATAGEFMQSVPAVDYYGTGLMHAINQKAIPREALAGFASGGSIGKSLLTDNYRLAGFDGLVGAFGQTLTALGGQGIPSLPPPTPTISFAGVTPVTSGPGGDQYKGQSSQPAGSGVEAAAQAYALSQLGKYGWGADQMPPLIALWNQESGWNPNAINKGSGAYGIPQSLGHGHVYDLGDYIAQVNWGLNYIDHSYGSPAAAEAHERAVDWYDGGGFLPPGLSMVANGIGSPEAVFTGQQWDLIKANLNGGGSAGGQFTGQLYLDSGELMGVVRGTVQQALDDTGRAIQTRTRTF
jgi:hypothetical protein